MVEYVVDFHCDTLLKLKDGKYDFNVDNIDLHVDLPKLKRSGVNVQVFSIFVEPKQPDLLFERVIQIIDEFYNLIENCDDLELATNFKEIKDIVENGKIAALLLLEGGDCLFDLSALRTLYRLGVRIVTLTHNKRNLIADGVGEDEACGGVTRFGKRVIKEMNRLGMVIDVSHLCEKSFWDVLKYSEDPVIASHSNAKSVCNHKRNLSDKQIIELAKKGGVIGINFCPPFLSEKEKSELIKFNESKIKFKDKASKDFQEKVEKKYNSLFQKIRFSDFYFKDFEVNITQIFRGKIPQFIEMIEKGKATGEIWIEKDYLDKLDLKKFKEISTEFYSSKSHRNQEVKKRLEILETKVFPELKDNEMVIRLGFGKGFDFTTVGDWIKESLGFKGLKLWFPNIKQKLNTFFDFPLTYWKTYNGNSLGWAKLTFFEKT